MLPIAYVQALLRGIPAKVRNVAYLVLGGAGLCLGTLEVLDVVSVPLIGIPVGKAILALVFVASALGFTASANVKPE